MKLSRHAITVLTRQYKSVLLKCALINAGLFLAVAPAMAEVTRVVVEPGDSATISDPISGLDNSALTGGAAQNSGELTVNEEINFSNNTAHAGGAIYSTGSQLTVGDSVMFIGNKTGGETPDAGAAIYAMGNETPTNVIIGDSVQFVNNASAQKAGAIFLEDANLTIGDSVLFKGNSSVANAGVLYNWNYLASDAQTTIGDEAQFLNNTAGTNGGVIANYDGKITLGELATFSTNKAGGNGGAVLNSNYLGTSVMTIADGATFENNVAEGLGGAVYNTGDLTINGSAEFSGNMDSTGANDIYNLGKLTLNATTADDVIALEGGISGDATNKGTTNISGEGSVVVSNTLTNQNVNNAGNLQLDGASLEGTEITGDGSLTVIGDSSLEGDITLEQELTVNKGQELDVSYATVTSTTGYGDFLNDGVLNIDNSDVQVDIWNHEKSFLNITDSTIQGTVRNAGVMYSDPTTYSGDVYNSGLATFDADTFDSTAALINTGVANLENGVTFESGATIEMAGTTNLVSGVTHFNDTTNENTINLANGANFDGTLKGGMLNTQNGAIDNILGSIDGVDVALDVNTTSLTADTFAGATNSTIKSVNVNGSYGTYSPTDTKTIALGSGLTLADDAEINGGYYTKVESDDAGNLVFSDKLVNTSAIQGTGDATTPAGDVVLGSVAATTTVGASKAQIALDNTAETATITAKNGVNITGNTSVKGTLTTTGSATIGKKLSVAGGLFNVTSSGGIVVGGSDQNFVVEGDGDVTTKGDVTAAGKLSAANGLFNVTSSGGIVVGGSDQNFVVEGDGDIISKGTLSVADGKFTVDGNGVVTAQGLKLDGATITGITTSTEMAALLADPTTASDANLVTEKALVSGISTVIAQKEQWAQGLLGVDTTQGTNNQLQNALNTLGTTDGKGNNISATTVAGALHELDVEKAGLDQNNVFTGQNTFANANGITIANGTDPAAADYAKTNLRATADGLAIDTGLSVDGALTTTGNALVGGALGVNGDTTLNGQLVVANQKATVLTGTLGVDGDTTLNGQLVVANQKATVLTGTLGVDGDTTLNGQLVVANQKATVLTGTLGVDGATTLNNTLTVKGVTALSDTNGMQFGAGQNVNAIDATEAGLTDKSATTLATVTTVLSSAQNADFTPAATSLTATRIGAAINQLNGNMHDVLGNVYSSTGAYDLSALNGNGFVTAGIVDDLTKDLNAYASNIATAFGGSFDDTTGVWSSGVTAKTSANYTGSVASTTVAGAMDTLAQVTYNIGTATNATYGNIASDNTVNANLDALDAAIGDRSFATTTYVAPNDDLSTAVTKLDKELHTVNHDVRKLRHDMDRGLASVAALSALVPNARGTGNTSLSVGTGYYNGHSAFALGGAHWFTDNLMVNIGAAASMGHTRDMTYRAGVSYSF